MTSTENTVELITISHFEVGWRGLKVPSYDKIKKQQHCSLPFKNIEKYFTAFGFTP